MANCYLVTDDSGVSVLLDPSDFSNAIQMLKKANGRLSAILLTHGHFDHIWALAKVAAFYSVPIYIHQSDQRCIQDNFYNVSATFGISYQNFLGETIALHDEEKLCFGDLTFEVIHTPGHSAGSVCYLCQSSLFSGDTVLPLSCGRVDLPGADPTSMTTSIKRIAQRSDIVNIYPGHGHPTSFSYEKGHNPCFLPFTLNKEN